MLFREKGKVSGNLHNVLNNEMTYLCIMKKIRHLLLILVINEWLEAVSDSDYTKLP